MSHLIVEAPIRLKDGDFHDFLSKLQTKSLSCKVALAWLPNRIVIITEKLPDCQPASRISPEAAML